MTTPHPETIVKPWGAVWWQAWCGTLYGVGRTPLDAIRELLDKEDKAARTWREHGSQFS